MESNGKMPLHGCSVSAAVLVRKSSLIGYSNINGEAKGAEYRQENVCMHGVSCANFDINSISSLIRFDNTFFD